MRGRVLVDGEVMLFGLKRYWANEADFDNINSYLWFYHSIALHLLIERMLNL